MRFRSGSSRWGLFLAAWLAAAVAVPGLLPAGAGPVAADLVAGGARASATTQHFLFHYDADRLSHATLAAAMAAAEAGYARCTRIFPVAGLGRKIEMDLTPAFVGATGYARPSEYAIAIRVPELDYLGLDLRYVMTHEVSHVFTYAELAARGAGQGEQTGPWGEGVADFAAGAFGEIPLADWWGRAFEAAGLWADPEWLVDGSYRPLDRDFVRERTCTYDQAALLIHYLVDRYGPDRFFGFYADYSKAVRQQARRRGRPTDQDRAALDTVFRSHFGLDGDAILARWNDAMESAAVPEEPAQRLTLHQQIYGSLREFEMRSARRRGRGDDATAANVREEFRTANRLLQEGDLPAAAKHLERACTIAGLRRTKQGPRVALWQT